MKKLRWLIWATAALTAVILVVFVTTASKTRHANAVQTSLPQGTATYDGTPISGITPPDVALTDQNGQQVHLTDFKGKVVVLSFLDTHCTDICPITAQELVSAYKSLGDKAKDVVFVGINVNLRYNSPADAVQFSHEHGLTKIPNWYYLTGSPKALQKMWKTYYMEVSIGKDGDINHTSAIYVLDRKSNSQWLINNPTRSESPADYSKLIAKHVLNLED